VIIAGGVLYISASAKPVAIVSAKAMIQRALLGLGILVASYLILYTINPQLLVMKFDVEEPGPIDITSAVEADEPGEVEVYYLNPTGIALQTLEGAAEEMYHLSEDGIPVSGTLYYDNYYNPVIAKTRPMVLAPRQGLFARIFNKIRPMPVLASDPPDVAPMIYQAELPLRQTEQIVLEMISIVMGDEKAGIIGLEELLQACKCGQSKHHTKWRWKSSYEDRTYSVNFTGECTGGMSEVEEGVYRESIKDVTPQKICLIGCEDCGMARFPPTKKGSLGELKCDLREIEVAEIEIEVEEDVKENIEIVLIKTSEKTETTELKWEVINWRPLDWDPEDGWEPSSEHTFTDADTEANTAPDLGAGDVKVSLELSTSVDKGKSIKYKRYQLQILLARLEGQKSKYFPEQIGPIDKTLANNAADYLLFNIAEPMFQGDFRAKQKEWEEQGLVVKMTPFKSSTGALDKKVAPPVVKQGAFDKFLAFFIKPVSAQLSKPINSEFHPATVFFVRSAPSGVVDESVTERNQFVYREAGRASLFSVLTDLPLEKIRGMFQSCLTSAFGEADYHITDEHLTGILEGALESGSMDEFVKSLTGDPAAMIGSIGETYADDLKGRVDLSCARDCGIKNATDAELDILDEDGVKEFEERLKEFIEEETNKECVDPCIKGNISPNYISRTVTEFLTADIDTWFGKEVKATLDGKIMENLGPDINKQLNTPMGRFYDGVLRGLLSKSLEDNIPRLTGMLDTKLTELPFLDVVLGRLKAVDEFLTCKISGCCRAVSDESQCIEETFNDIGGIKQCGPPWRNVATKHQCKKEVFRNIDGKTPQCCEQGLRQKMDAFATDKVKALVRKYTTQKAVAFIEGVFYPEYRSPEDCKLRKGYYFSQNDSFKTQFNVDCLTKTTNDPGECIEMTPDDINQLLGQHPDWSTETTKYIVEEEEDSEEGCLKYDIDDKPINKNIQKDVCIGAGYFWDEGYADETTSVYAEGRSGSKMCVESPAGGKSNVRKIKDTVTGAVSDLKRGAVTLGGQFISAFIETTLHMAIEYAKVWIEDTITAPLMPYFKQVMKFQDSLHKFFNASVRDILPGSIRDTLEKNFDDLIADMCKMYKAQKEAGETTIKFAKYDWLKWDEDPDPKVTNYQPLTFEVNAPEISDNFGHKVCQLNMHLHTTMLEEIAASSDFGSEVVGILKSSIKEQLDNPDLCSKTIDGKRWTCKQLLEMNLAEMVFAFTPLKNITKLLTATPREIICGEVAIEWEKDDGTTHKLSPSAECQKMELMGSLDDLLPDGDGTEKDFYKALLGPIDFSLPFVNKASQTYKDLLPAAKKFYEGYCPAVWGICKKVGFSSVFSEDATTIGSVIKLILDAGCTTLSKTLKNGLTIKDEDGEDVELFGQLCQGKCLNDTKNPVDPLLEVLQEDEDEKCLDEFQQICSGCNTLLKNTMAYTFFYWLIEEEFGEPSLEKKGEEGEIYQWLYIYFGKLENDIKNVALKRGFTQIEWLALKGEVDRKEKTLNDYDFANINESVWLQGFIQSFNLGTIRSIFTTIPFGVVKPKRKGGGTILRPTTTGKNFLAKTPAELLTVNICGKIISDFKEDENLNYWYLDEVAKREKANLGKAVPYSMESLDSSTKAKSLDIILHASIPGEKKIPYLFCEVLKHSPAEVVGLDQALMTYIRPKQAQIMFQLIDDKLTYTTNLATNEMPKKLYDLISYLNSRTPSIALNDVANTINTEPDDQLKRLFSVKVDPGINLGNFSDDPVKTVKDAFRNFGLGFTDEKFSSIDINIGDVPTPAMAMYSNKDTDNENPLGFYVIKITTGTKHFLVVYYNPAKLKGGIQSFAKFLNTPVGGLISGGLAGDTIIDIICKTPFQVPITGEDVYGWCDTKFNTDREDILKAIEDFLSLTPADLLTKYLKYPLVGCEGDKCKWKRPVSIMDWLVIKAPFLGQPYVDSLGRKLGWDKYLFEMEEGKDAAQELIDKSVVNMKTAAQDKMNRTFIEKPAQAVEYLTRKFAELIGGETGAKLAADLTGVCAEKDPDNSGNVYTESACKTAGKVYRPSTGGKPAECCDLGRNVVCEPRCRQKDIQACDEASGEEEIMMPAPILNRPFCCRRTHKEIVDGTEQQYCKYFRIIPATDDAANRGCREDEKDAEDKDRREQITVNDKEVEACYKLRLRIQKEEKDDEGNVIEKTDKCCTTVVDCVSSQFDEHLRVLANTLSDGSVPLDSLTD